MVSVAHFRKIALISLVLSTPLIMGKAYADEALKGQVLLGGAAIAKSTVTLWEASAAAPKQLGQAKTDGDGWFDVRGKSAGKDSVLYLTASGGEPKAKQGAGENPAIVLLCLLGNKAPDKVVVNEFTTIASAFTAARFIDGTSISGNPLGLRVAAMNVPNFANLQTGSWGKVIIDPFNSFRSTTLAKFDTMASLITYAATSASADWRTRFFSAATPDGGKTPSNTLEAIAGIARQSFAHPQDLFGLFQEAYPQAKAGSASTVPFLPYLFYAPDDFALILWFAGGGLDSSGRLMFDADGNAWIGNNWMPGSQSGVALNIGGAVAELASDGTPLSPPILGFRGGGIDSIGWGGAVTLKNVWMPSLNGKIFVGDFHGNAVAQPGDFPFHEKITNLMGTAVARNGDVWIADGAENQLLYFPDGRVKDGKIVKPAGLESPFDVVIDNQNRVWVSNSQSATISRFPIGQPNDVQTFRVGLSPRGMALDSKNNVWIVSLVSPQDLKYVPKVPAGASIMQQFQVMLGGILKAIVSGEIKATGMISMIRPDGTQPDQSGFSGNGGVNLPWGINIDGNDDVWTTNGMRGGAVYMAGDSTKGHPAGTKTGDLIHVFYDGTLQTLTDICIDPAGNVWIVDNWNDLPVATGTRKGLPSEGGVTAPANTSTWGGGWGITVLFGAAAPVKPPKMGAVQSY